MQSATTNAHPTVKKLFGGRRMVVASMHGKELVMKPLIRQYLNLDAILIPQFDTDEFGTFSGEVERPFDPVTTLRKKILKGLAESGETLGIGNEGSFGPHPHIPFVHANQEIVMLIDLDNDIEIFETVISTETNHAQKEITGMKDLVEFAEQIQFPFHGMILKQVKNNKVVAMQKGIVTWEHLYAASLQLHTADTQLIAETDMRGFLNPTRMKVIERATELLMKKITSLCPDCQWPGFSQTEVKPGLPCQMCGHPTRLPLIKIYSCQHCSYTDERYYADGQKADPGYCDHCNP